MKTQSQDAKKQIQPLKQSASIILFQNSFQPKKLLMFKRIAKISFGTAVVFPGGACDKQDREFTLKHFQSNKFEDYTKITAIRELLQQTGILLIPKKDSSLIIKLKKLKLGLNPHEDLQFLTNLWKGHLHLIVPLIRFLTVQFIPQKRFDTTFYTHHPQVTRINMAKISQLNQTTQSLYDLSQLKMSSQGQTYFWQSPQTLLQLYRKQEIYLVPPQLIILNCLKNVTSFEQLFYLDQKSCYQPILMNTNNMKTFALFGDHEYVLNEVLKYQPESESKTSIIKYFDSTMLKGEQTSQKMLRRFDIDIKIKNLYFKTDFTEKSILAFLKPNSKM